MIHLLKHHYPRVLLGLLLIFHSALISLQAKNLEGTSLLKVWLINVNAPIIRVLAGSSQGIKRLWRKYIHFRGLYDENEALKRRVAHLQLQVWKTAETEAENLRFIRLLQLARQQPNQAVGARVVIKKPSFFSQTIFIDKGYNDGLRKDTPIVSVEGVVGHVSSVGRMLSEVRLLTNSGAAANAAIEARGVQGVINGTGEEWMKLMYVRAEQNVQVGDLVTTFGMDLIYPKGIPIGTVVEVGPTTGLYKDIRVKPATDIDRLEDVLLLIKP